MSHIEPLTRKDKVVYWWLRLTCYMGGIGPALDWRAEWRWYLGHGRKFWVDTKEQ